MNVLRLSAVPLLVLATHARSQMPATSLEPVVVTATRTERSALDVPASVDLIERDVLRDARLRVNLSETLARVPGVVVLERQNYAQDLQISMRGFGSRATFGVRGVRLYVDGVPASAPDGQGQVSHFPLNAAERIEVLRGPFSALYGNNSGGVIALTTELKPQPWRVEAGGAFGSYETWRLGINAVGGAAPYAFALDGARFETAGPRAHSRARRDTANLRMALLDSPLGRARVSINAIDMPDTQDPQGLTRAQFDADPTQVGSPALQFNTRKSTRQATLGGDLASELNRETTLATTAWIGQREVTQFQSIPVAAQVNPRHPGGVIAFDRVFGGADVRAIWERGAATAVAGLYAERLSEDRRGYENFDGAALGVQGRLRRDETNTVTATDGYAQLELRLDGRWRLHAGARAARVEFASSDRYIVGVNGDDSGSQAFSAINPTVGIVFRPAADLAYYASYGRGFEAPTLNELAYRADGSAGFNQALRAARSNNLEVGVKARVSSSLRATLAAFAVATRDDLVVRTNVGGRSAFGNVARTRRDGVEAAVQWRPAPLWSLSASLAWLDARFDQGFLTCGPAPCTTPTVPVAAGNKLPGVPARTFFAEVKHAAGWADLTAQWRAQSKLFVNDVNSDRAAGYGVLGLSLARDVQVAGYKPRVFARIDNLLDRTYAGSVIINEGNSRFFEPAPGRTWLVGVDLPL